MTFHKAAAPPPADEVLGAVSVVFWALTLLLLIKYTLVVLHADDQGNGGTFALYSILRRQGMQAPEATPAAAMKSAGSASSSSSAGAAAAAAEAAAAARAASAPAPVAAPPPPRLYQKRMTLEDDSSDTAVSAGISTFARGPEARRRASVDFGGGGGGGGGGGETTRRRSSAVFYRASTMGAAAAAAADRRAVANSGSSPSGSGELRGAASWRRGREGAGLDLRAASVPAARGNNIINDVDADVEAPPPPPKPDADAAASNAPLPRRPSSPFARKAASAPAEAPAAAPSPSPFKKASSWSSSSSKKKSSFSKKKNDDDAESPKDWRQRLIERPRVQLALKAMVVVGVGAILGDGVLTPSMSVVSAVEGLARPFPRAFAKGEAGVVGLAAAILAVLFLCQRFGTAGVAVFFSPIAVAWCLSLAAIGVYNLVVVPSSVALNALAALSPHHAFLFFVRNGAEGWRSLGSLALCITGAEALFADLGHFNRKSITIATTCLVYPSLILT